MFGVIAVRNRYDRVQSMNAGRLWQRLHLLATSQGLAGRPVNEIVELVDFERQRDHPPEAEQFLASLAGDPNGEPTFMFRLGYPMRSAPASPRRSASQVVIGSFPV